MTACPEYVSTIIRLHDPARIDRLQLALMSLCAQRHRCLAPVIVLQSFACDDESRVRQIAERLPWPEEAWPVEIVNLTALPKGDHRAKLMNAGLKATKGDYVGFLDFDDYLYPNAYSSLIEQMKLTGKSAAFGRLSIAEIDPRSPGGFCVTKRAFPTSTSKYDVFEDNIYPIHSFLMRRCITENVSVSEELSALEDYHFLLMVLTNNDWDDTLVDSNPIGEYVYWADNSNTISGSSCDLSWRDARTFVNSFKKSLQIKVPLRYFARHSVAYQAIFPRLTLRLLPFLQFGKRLDGRFERVEWDGTHLTVTGQIEAPSQREATVGHLFLRRASWLRPSYRHLASFDLNYVITSTGDYLSFTATTRLLPQRMWKGRDCLTLYVQADNGQLYASRANAQPRERRAVSSAA